MIRSHFLLLIALLCGPSVVRAAQPPGTAVSVEDFERRIRPLLSRHCYECHAADASTIHGGLRLDRSDSIRTGGDSGVLVVPGEPDASLLIEVVEYDGDIQMPPEGRLPQSDIDTLRKWIRDGAPLPDDSGLPPTSDAAIDFDAGRAFWSFQPLEESQPPPVDNADWPRNRIDHFVLAAMERNGLQPSPRADRATLVRRLYFDVIGLPPTPADIAEFLAYDSPTAWESQVDRLLSSPRHGEKWARLWLDLARYTDTTATWLYQTAQAHHYRDWVVRALNDDMPYDEFVHRQLATDMMDSTGPDDLAALGFLALSPTYWKELKLPCEVIRTIVADEHEERVDAVTRTFLGLTVACARCHDHKFDPVSSEDYYALAGVFASSRQVERPMIAEDLYAPVREAKQQVAELEGQLAELKRKTPAPADDIDRLTEKIAAIRSTTPHYDAPLANALSEESLYVVRAGDTPQDGTRLEYRSSPRDLPLSIRGNPNRPGPVIPRRFLTIFDRSQTPFTNGSGRLELARAITTDAAPLAARVIVNRIWAAHFGRGLVDTPSNFGRQGSRPSHPRLLDDLAARFIDHNWSLRWLHREILLSATWQQSSAWDAERTAADPENRWLSRMNRRRLHFEEWRDAMLSVAGVLDLTQGGPSSPLDDVNNARRTLYGTVNREEPLPTLQIHDVPDPTQHSPQRIPTVTPLQGLYALNGPLLRSRARQLAARLRQETSDDTECITRAYRLLFARPPTDAELNLASEFRGTGEGRDADLALADYLHVLLASNEFLLID